MSDVHAIISLDPGGTTGWAAYKGLPASTDYTINEFSHGQIGPEEHHTELWHLLNEWRQSFSDLTVVCESFEFRQHDNHRDNVVLDSKEYIGLVKLFRDMWGIPTYFQTAGKAKPFVTDEKLRVMELWVPGQKHARDAFRHLVTYMVQKEKRHDLIQSWRNL